MGEKKKSDRQHNNDAKSSTTFDFSVEICASQITRSVLSIPGGEIKKVDSVTTNLRIVGKLDPEKDNLAKKVKPISPQQKKKNQDSKSDKILDDKPKKNTDKKTKPPVTTAVLKIALDCQGCIDRIHKIVWNTEGVHKMSIDKENETVTVKGTMDVKALVKTLSEKLTRKVEVVPPKKDKERGKAEKGGNGGGKKK